MSSSKNVVFIAIDGSDQAKYAFDWYLENAHREGNFVILAHCAEYHIDIGFPGVNPDVEKINQYCEEVKKKSLAIEELTNGYMEVLRNRKIQAKLTLINEHKPGEALTKAAKAEGAKHIIMGTRGLGTIRRTLLGSVSEYMVHHCDCPITIVREHHH